MELSSSISEPPSLPHSTHHSATTPTTIIPTLLEDDDADNERPADPSQTAMTISGK